MTFSIQSNAEIVHDWIVLNDDHVHTILYWRGHLGDILGTSLSTLHYMTHCREGRTLRLRLGDILRKTQYTSSNNRTFSGLWWPGDQAKDIALYQMQQSQRLQHFERYKVTVIAKLYYTKRTTVCWQLVHRHSLIEQPLHSLLWLISSKCHVNIMWWHLFTLTVISSNCHANITQWHLFT